MSFLNIGQKIDKVMGKESELLDAARTGNLQTVDKLLTGKPRKSVGGGALSHRLTSIWHSPVNVNCTDKNGYTPLHHATVNGHREVVERLLKSDAEPGLADHQGCTPCHLAAWHGDAEICLQLLNAGTENLAEVPSEITPVQVNHQNLSGDTALHSAAQYGHVAVVDVLLQKHANPSIRNLQEESPLDLAAQYGRKEVVQLLLIQFPDLVQRPLCNHSPLHLASRNGHKEVVQVLLDAGFFLHTLTDTGTALHEAALFGKLDVVKLLLETGINVYEKDQKGQTALDLVDAHKAKQKSYMEIKTAIIEHMEKLKLANLDDGDYDSLASTAKGSQEVLEKIPERTAPVPRPRTYIKESPTEDTHKDQYGYSHPQKDKIEDIDRVTSSTSSISEASSPPPLPPRTSVFPGEDMIPVIVQPPKPPVTATSSTESKSPTLSGRPTAMPRPKKPPRQKKSSPAPARRTSAEGSESSTSEPSLQTPDTPPPNLPPKPTSPKVPPKPGSLRNSQKVIPSAMSNSTDENHDIDSSTVVTEQLHSSETETDQSKSLLQRSKTDQSGAITTDIEQPQSTYSEIDQSDKQPVNDQSNRSSYGFQLSPTPELPPKPCGPNSIETIDPVFGTPVQQNVYMEMKPTETKQPETQNTELKPGEVNVDNYDILFPKFKNTKGNSLQQSPSKTKKPEFRRTNTAPDENIYVGPSSPESTLAKFKEKQGLLRRANTSPDENMYITVTEKILKRQEKVEIENEYSEISEQKSPKSPQSPSENVYEVIPEKRDSNIYAEVKDAHSGTKERNSDVSERDNSEAVSESSTMDSSKQKETDETENIPAGSKPNYLDFVARKSLSHDPLTPTGYTQPPTPDFPPPSPATALQGIEMKIQEMEVKRKSRDITTLTDESLDSFQDQTLKNSSETVHTEENCDTMSKKGPAPPLKPKPVRSVKKVPSPVENHTENTEASQRENEHSTERAEAFQIIEEEPDTCKKVPKTQNSSIDKSLSSDFEKLVTEKSSKTVIESTETIVSKQKSNKQETEQSKNEDATQSSKQETDQSKSKDGTQSESPVMMRKKNSTSSAELDQYKDLLKGSNPGGPRKVVSQFVYDHDKSQPGRRKPVKSTYVTFDSVMEKEDDIDVDQVMKSIEIDFQRASGGGNSDSQSIDDAGVWDEIDNVLQSVGSGIARESVFIRDIEADFIRNLQQQENQKVHGIEEWLENLDLDQYENNFRVNGFDNLDFLGPSIMEEQDLEQIGILDHSHRQKILEAAKFLPQITPIDPKNLPPSVEDWLISLRLEAYLQNFISHGYETMEQVESILWDLQLRTVLAISMLGHRKRILASLGERQPDRQNGSVKKKSFSALSPDEVPSPYKDIDLFKDYSKVKSTKSSSEELREPSPMNVDDDDVFRKGSKGQGQSIRNSNIHLRPPHIAQTQSPAKKWRHTPEKLIKGCCNYTSEYLGSTSVAELQGVESTRAGITKLKKSTDNMAKIPVIMLSISYKGVKFIDATSKKVICDHEIGNIFCACQDTDDLRFFAYITRDIETARHYCHVFKVKSSSLAHDIILTLGESFEVAYQMALKDKSMEEAMELDRLKSQSDTDDLYAKVGPKIDSNTV